MMILPRPVTVKKDRKGIDFTRIDGWRKKIEEEAEELYYAIDRHDRKQISEEAVDLMTVCNSLLNWLGYDEAARERLFAACNAKNESRGYFNA